MNDVAKERWEAAIVERAAHVAELADKAARKALKDEYYLRDATVAGAMIAALIPIINEQLST